MDDLEQCHGGFLPSGSARAEAGTKVAEREKRVKINSGNVLYFDFLTTDYTNYTDGTIRAGLRMVHKITETSGRRNIIS